MLAVHEKPAQPRVQRATYAATHIVFRTRCTRPLQCADRVLNPTNRAKDAGPGYVGPRTSRSERDVRNLCSGHIAFSMHLYPATSNLICYDTAGTSRLKVAKCPCQI